MDVVEHFHLTIGLNDRGIQLTIEVGKSSKRLPFERALDWERNTLNVGEYHRIIAFSASTRVERLTVGCFQ